jgi:maltooligosyltrehalose trehalohydrolase
MGAMTLFGATAHDVVEFRVWAPYAKRVTVRLLGHGDFPMRHAEGGMFETAIDCAPGDRYFCVLDDHKPVPDPVSRLLPEGVHGPTEIVSPEFHWHDENWRGRELREYTIYELHVGTFSPSGTFDGVIEKLGYLKRLGVSVIELMPVAAFPGTRGWGYDGVNIYAVQASYGGPHALKRLVDEAHQEGIAVMLDVVYNHLGPEGNYLRLFGPYFTSKHHTPWGDAINYDQAGCEQVRRYVVENALYWIREYHLDGLRLDAVQTIHDDSRLHILAELQEHVQRLAGELGRSVCVIAEDDRNNPKLVQPRSSGGYGLHALWSDDFHHSVHVALTGEHEGYYQDFGALDQLVRALNHGFVYQGEHFKFWDKPRGHKPEGMSPPHHVICIQNHDQVGNRARGERIDALVPRGAHKLAAALLLLAPHTPLLFMGEEYAEQAPFLFFSDFSDPALQKAVTEGRRKEFKDFTWNEVPDPQDPATFERSKLTHSLEKPSHRKMYEWYDALLALRRNRVIPHERTCKAELRGQNTVFMQVPAKEPQILVFATFPGEGYDPELPEGAWKKTLWSQQDGYEVIIYTRAE